MQQEVVADADIGADRGEIALADPASERSPFGRCRVRGEEALVEQRRQVRIRANFAYAD